MCDIPVVVGESTLDGEGFIRWLVDRNLFVIPLDSSNEWFRLHHLFQGVLQKLLEDALEDNEISALHSRASRWFADQELIDQAMNHALTANDLPFAVELVTQRRYELMNTEQWSRLRRWMDLLPPDIVATNPELILAKANLVERLGKMSQALELVDQAEYLLSELSLDAHLVRRLQGEIAIFRCEQNVFLGNSDLAIEDANKGLASVPDEAVYIRSYGVGLKSIGHQISGNLDQATSTVEGAQNSVGSAIDVFHANVGGFSALACWMDGDLAQARNRISQYMDYGYKYGMPDHICIGRSLLGSIHYFRNELQEAERYLTALAAEPYNDRPSYFAIGCLTLALVYLARRQVEEAEQVVKSAISLVEEMDATPIAAMCRVFQVEMALRRGHITRAVHLGRIADFDSLPIIWLSYVPQLTQVKLLIAQGAPNDLNMASVLLDEIDEYLVSNHRNTVRIDVLALQALVLGAQGARPLALERLKESLQLAELWWFHPQLCGPGSRHGATAA